MSAIILNTEHVAFILIQQQPNEVGTNKFSIFRKGSNREGIYSFLMLK